MPRKRKSAKVQILLICGLRKAEKTTASTVTQCFESGRNASSGTSSFKKTSCAVGS
ncbi:hypothetical protein J6590_071536 [Homalodisca vitripennis]|nr:hypothetical protein J6590_071536 [Homalodisca vitripennis]